MNRFAIVSALALLAAGPACSKHSEARSPNQVAYGEQSQAPSDESAFGEAWDAVTEAGGAVGEAGEWTVKRLEDGAIAVWHGTEKVAGRAGVATEDAAITSSVKARLAESKDVSASDIDVDTDKGVVKLTGHVSSRMEAAKAIRIALDTRGVDRVVSYLTW